MSCFVLSFSHAKGACVIGVFCHAWDFVECNGCTQVTMLLLTWVRTRYAWAFCWVN